MCVCVRERERERVCVCVWRGEFLCVREIIMKRDRYNNSEMDRQ